jgi:hypothetical protein
MKSNLIIYTLVFIISCKSQNHRITVFINNNKPVPNIFIKNIRQDQYDVFFNINNGSLDTIIFPLKFLSVSVSFTELYPEKIVTAKRIYPTSNFNKLSDSKKLEIIEKFCVPFIDFNKGEYVILYPNDSINIQYNLIQAYFKGFEKDKKYKGIVTISIPDDIKRVCSRIWSGSMEKEIIFQSFETW